MRIRALAYAAVCVLALGYLLVANARGYEPFATPGVRSLPGSVNHFHK